MTLDIYAIYYNYTLQKVIETKLGMGLQFRESDMMYILESLVSVGKVLQQYTKT